MFEKFFLKKNNEDIYEEIETLLKILNQNYPHSFRRWRILHHDGWQGQIVLYVKQWLRPSFYLKAKRVDIDLLKNFSTRLAQK